MGAWGGALYDSDFARDMKATIGALLRAPLAEDELLAEIRANCGGGADGPDAPDYWLVLADQLERHGLPRRDVLDRAIAIIETGEDIAALEDFEADPKAIAERRRDTASLLARLRAPRPAKTRRPLRKPQPLLLAPGEGLTWPTDGGDSINPYVAPDRLWQLGGFTPDGWGFGIVTDAGHRFHVLAYYAVQPLMWRRAERPSPDLAAHCPRGPHHYGTTSDLHLQRTRVERLGAVPPEAMGPPVEPGVAERMSRRAVAMGVGLSAAFGYDAWNHWVIPGPKFIFTPPSGTLLDPDEPDQRPGRPE